MWKHQRTRTFKDNPGDDHIRETEEEDTMGQQVLVSSKGGGVKPRSKTAQTSLSGKNQRRSSWQMTPKEDKPFVLVKKMEKKVCKRTV